MTGECNDIERSSARAGDKYYRSMTEWLTRRRDSVELKARVSVFARAYGRSLDVLIRCLDRLRPSEKAEHKIEIATELKKQVEKDVEYLQRPVANLTTAPEET